MASSAPWLGRRLPWQMPKVPPPSRAVFSFAAGNHARAGSLRRRFLGTARDSKACIKGACAASREAGVRVACGCSCASGWANDGGTRLPLMSSTTFDLFGFVALISSHAACCELLLPARVAYYGCRQTCETAVENLINSRTGRARAVRRPSGAGLVGGNATPSPPLSTHNTAHTQKVCKLEKTQKRNNECAEQEISSPARGTRCREQCV